MALFVPAVSSAYKSINSALPDYDFLDTYPYALYSVGHSGFANHYPLTSAHRQMIIGDSGGYQIGTGKWKRDWKGRDKKTEALVERVYNWLQHCDVHMTLDVPLWGLSVYDNMDHKDCVAASKQNAIAFLQSPKTVLNVMSGGDTLKESLYWLNEMAVFSDPNKERFFEGYSFSGLNVGSFAQTLFMLKTLYDKGCLTSAHKHIHMLGTGKLFQAWLYHILNDVLKEVTGNESFLITCDAASSFLLTANATYSTGYKIGHGERFRILSSKDRLPKTNMSVYDYYENRNWTTTPVLKHYNLDNIVDGNGKYTPVFYDVFFNHNTRLANEAHYQLMLNYKTTCPEQFICDRVPQKHELFEHKPINAASLLYDEIHKYFTLPKKENMTVFLNQILKKISTVDGLLSPVEGVLEHV